MVAIKVLEKKCIHIVYGLLSNQMLGNFFAVQYNKRFLYAKDELNKCCLNCHQSLREEMYTYSLWLVVKSNARKFLCSITKDFCMQRTN